VPPIQIESLDDPRIQDYRHVADPSYLRDRGLFVAEGRLVVRQLLPPSSWTLHSVLLTPTAAASFGDALAATPAPVFLVDQSLMNDIAGFNIHRGCLGLAARPAARTLAPTDLAARSRVVVLEGVSNPDNVGGIFRSAAAFGVETIILGPSCGDPLYRKAVRTSMAATLAVPFVDAGAWPAAIELLRAQGFTVVALTPQSPAIPLGALPSTSRVALLLGAEGDGLTDDALAGADVRVRIPMTGAVDSLNVTTAASIAMYHAFGLHLEDGAR
jgi:tRNA G18 (ribose-2'-O)-methylase SpoU